MSLTIQKFMNAKQVEYFKTFINWRKDILQESSNTLDHLKEESLISQIMQTEHQLSQKEVWNSEHETEKKTSQ